MGGIGSSADPADPESASASAESADRYDDDALADAIYLSYTASIPIIRMPEAGGPAVPPPAPAPVPPPVPAPVAPAPAAQAQAPAAATPTAPAPVSDVPAPEPESDTAGGRIWDLDDLPSPVGFAPPPTAPVIVGVPVTPAPIVIDADEPAPKSWTRLAEPATPSGPVTTDPIVAEPTVAEPAARPAATESVPPESTTAESVPAAADPGWAPPAWSPPEPSDPEPSDPEPSDPEPSDPEPSGPVSAGSEPAVAESAAPEREDAEPPAEPPQAPPDAPAVRRDPIPWFDLAAAPPPDPRTASTAATAPAAPPPLVEPSTAEPEPSTAEPEPDPRQEPGPPPASVPGPEPAPVEPPAPDAAPESEPAPPAPDPRETVAESVVVLPAARRPIPPSRPQISSEVLDILPPLPEPVVPDPEIRLPGVRPVETAGVEPTPVDQRAGRAGRLFWLWFAANASVLSIAVGAGLIGLGLSPRQALIAIVLGLALSFLPLGVTTVAGRWSGQPTLVVSRATFGLIGNIVPAVLAVLTRVGWGGVLVWLGGEAVVAALDRGGIAAPRLATAPGAGLIVGILALVLATVGYGLLSRAQFAIGAVVGVLAVGLVALTAARLDPAQIVGIADGNWMLVLPGAVLVFVFVGLAWTQSGADLARYQSPRSSGSGSVVAAGAGAAVPALVLMGWGVLLAASLPGRTDALVRAPAATLLALVPVWAAVPVAVLIVLAGIAGAGIAAYSGGFALLAAGLRVPRRIAALLSGLLVTIVGMALLAAAAGSATAIWDAATTLAIPVAAWAGLFGGEMLLRTRPFHAPSLLDRGGVYPDVRIVNLVALVVASAIGLGFASASTPWLTWEGWFFPLLGIPLTGLVAGSHLGILVALGLALLVPIVGSVGAVRRRETALA